MEDRERPLGDGAGRLTGTPIRKTSEIRGSKRWGVGGIAHRLSLDQIQAAHLLLVLTRSILSLPHA